MSDISQLPAAPIFRRRSAAETPVLDRRVGNSGTGGSSSSHRHQHLRPIRLGIGDGHQLLFDGAVSPGLSSTAVSSNAFMRHHPLPQQRFVSTAASSSVGVHHSHHRQQQQHQQQQQQQAEQLHQFDVFSVTGSARRGGQHFSTGSRVSHVSGTVGGAAASSIMSPPPRSDSNLSNRRQQAMAQQMHRQRSEWGEALSHVRFNIVETKQQPPAAPPRDASQFFPFEVVLRADESIRAEVVGLHYVDPINPHRKHAARRNVTPTVKNTCQALTLFFRFTRINPYHCTQLGVQISCAPGSWTESASVLLDDQQLFESAEGVYLAMLRELELRRANFERYQRCKAELEAQERAGEEASLLARHGSRRRRRHNERDDDKEQEASGASSLVNSFGSGSVASNDGSESASVAWRREAGGSQQASAAAQLHGPAAALPAQRQESESDLLETVEARVAREAARKNLQFNCLKELLVRIGGDDSNDGNNDSNDNAAAGAAAADGEGPKNRGRMVPLSEALCQYLVCTGGVVRVGNLAHEAIPASFPIAVNKNVTLPLAVYFCNSQQEDAAAAKRHMAFLVQIRRRCDPAKVAVRHALLRHMKFVLACDADSDDDDSDDDSSNTTDDDRCVIKTVNGRELIKVWGNAASPREATNANAKAKAKRHLIVHAHERICVATQDIFAVASEEERRTLRLPMFISFGDLWQRRDFGELFRGLAAAGDGKERDDDSSADGDDDDDERDSRSDRDAEDEEDDDDDENAAF